jgi:hypothetical protein
VPGSVIEEAVFAGTALCAFRVIVCVLVEGDEPERVEVAEYVPASSTVMPSCEIGEVSSAGCFVADVRLGIGLGRRIN